MPKSAIIRTDEVLTRHSYNTCSNYPLLGA